MNEMKKRMLNVIQLPEIVTILISLLLFTDAFSPFQQSLRYNGKRINNRSSTLPHNLSSLTKRRKKQSYSAARDTVVIEDDTNGMTRDAEEFGRSQLQQYFSFPIDGWQAKAGGEVLKDKNVIVCAPTGMLLVCNWIHHNLFCILSDIIFEYSSIIYVFSGVL